MTADRLSDEGTFTGRVQVDGLPRRRRATTRNDPVLSVREPEPPADEDEPDEFRPASRLVRLAVTLGALAVGGALVVWLLSGWNPAPVVLAYCGLLGLLAMSGSRNEP